MPLEWATVTNFLKDSAKTLSSLRYAFGLFLIVSALLTIPAVRDGNTSRLVVSLIVAFAAMFLLLIFHRATKSNSAAMSFASSLIVIVVAVLFCLSIVFLAGRAFVADWPCVPVVDGSCISDIDSGNLEDLTTKVSLLEDKIDQLIELVSQIKESGSGPAEQVALIEEGIADAQDVLSSATLDQSRVDEQLNRIAGLTLRAQLLRQIATENTTGMDTVEFIDQIWAKTNIVAVTVPFDLRWTNGGTTRSILFHKRGADQLLKVFTEIGNTGKSEQILEYCGSYVARYMRGGLERAESISTHALGIALDINCGTNQYGRPPPASGTPGSVADLAPIFAKHGFAWGAESKRKDPMHFELLEFRDTSGS